MNSSHYYAQRVSKISINGCLLANSIDDAVGKCLYKAPSTPERVLKALKEKENK